MEKEDKTHWDKLVKELNDAKQIIMKPKNDQLLQITKYIVEQYKVISLVKLQKILYFLYLEYLKKYDEQLFDDDFEAWVHGPVLRKVFAYVRNNGFNFSELEGEYYIDYIPPLENVKIKNFIDERICKYLECESWQLVEITHITPPWKIAREGLSETEPSNRKISLKDMKDYVQTWN